MQAMSVSFRTPSFVLPVFGLLKEGVLQTGVINPDSDIFGHSRT